MTKQVRALEEEYEQTESRLHAANEKLELATKAADESERYGTIRYDTLFTCAQKLTNSQLNLPRATKQKKSNEETNK